MTEKPPIELWGIECTINRVSDRFFDQLARCGHYARLDDLDAVANADWRGCDAALERLRDLGWRRRGTARMPPPRRAWTSARSQPGRSWRLGTGIRCSRAATPATTRRVPLMYGPGRGSRRPWPG